MNVTKPLAGSIEDKVLTDSIHLRPRSDTGSFTLYNRKPHKIKSPAEAELMPIAAIYPSHD